MQGQPFTTIEELPDGSLEFQFHIPVGEGSFVVGFREDGVKELRDQLDEFLKLADEGRALDAIIAADAGGH